MCDDSIKAQDDNVTLARLHTREASTLVVLTVLGTASLLLLTVPFNTVQDTNAQDKLSLRNLASLGITFAFIGLIYRQLTTWTSDHEDYNKLSNIRKIRQCKRIYYGYALSREFFLLLFVSMPISIWTLILRDNSFKLLNFNEIFLLAFSIAGIVTFIDYVYRLYDSCND